VVPCAREKSPGKWEIGDGSVTYASFSSRNTNRRRLENRSVNYVWAADA